MNFLSFSFEKINLIYLGKIKKWYFLIQVCSNFSMKFLAIFASWIRNRMEDADPKPGSPS